MIEIKAIASSSKGNAYWVTDGKTPLLLEAGIPVMQIKKAINFTLSEVHGCLVTHEHMDHGKAVKDLMKAGVDCYMSQGTAGALKVAGHRLKTIEAKKQFSIGSWTILPFDTVHDAADPLGFLLASGSEKLLFLTDTAYCKYRFKGVSHLMIECNYMPGILRKNVSAGTIVIPQKNRLLHSHFSLDNVLEFLNANDLSALQEIWLLHLSDGNSNEAAMKEAAQKATGKPVYVAQES